jgi:hypothetical protein
MPRDTTEIRNLPPETNEAISALAKRYRMTRAEVLTSLVRLADVALTTVQESPHAHTPERRALIEAGLFPIPAPIPSPQQFKERFLHDLQSTAVPG